MHLQLGKEFLTLLPLPAMASCPLEMPETSPAGEAHPLLCSRSLKACQLFFSPRMGACP